MRKSVKVRFVLFGAVVSVLLAGCAGTPSEQGSDAGSSFSPAGGASSRAASVREDFRASVVETVEATGVAEKDFKYEGGQVFSAEDLKGDLKDFTQTCSGNAKDGFENEYSTGLIGGRRYVTRAQWEAQAQKVKEHWEKLGWTVKNVAPGTEESPGITIGASTPAGVTVLYTVGQKRWDYVRVSSPCSAEIQ